MKYNDRNIYFQVKRDSKQSAPHKVPCKCGYYNDPTKLRKRDGDKYFRCWKCGRELKSAKDDFKDNLMLRLKGGTK